MTWLMGGSSCAGDAARPRGRAVTMMPRPTLVPCSRPAASSTAAPAAAKCATRRRPTTTAIAPPAPSARRSTTRTRSTSSARCRSGRTRCCCAGARSSRAAACGRCPPASWSSARRPRRARCARPSRRPARKVEFEGLYSLINVVRVGQVHLFYRARMLDTDFVPGPESIEAGLSARPRSRGRDRLPDDEADARVLLRRPARRPLRLAPRRRRLIR